VISAEFRRARAILGLSDDALAAEMGVTPAVVRAWDSGSTTIPTRFAQHLSWLSSRAERDAALAVSGLLVCAWMTSRPEQRLDANARELVAEAERVLDHAKACPICVARDRFVMERFGPMPEPPAPAWARVIGWVDGLPTWARPAAVGGALLGVIVALRLVFALPTLSEHPAPLAEAFRVVVADWLALGIVAVVVGLVVGHRWLGQSRED
jgi:transcriptional regulator with XRE-family HTH domain